MKTHYNRIVAFNEQVTNQHNSYILIAHMQYTSEVELTVKVNLFTLSVKQGFITLDQLSTTELHSTPPL